MTKDPRVYLAHIIECATRIRLYIASGEDGFQRDTMIQDAVIRNFEVIEKPSNVSLTTIVRLIQKFHGA